MTTTAGAPTKWAAQSVEDAFRSAVISGIVPDKRHLDGGGYHVSIDDLVRHGNGGDYSNRRPGDVSPPVTVRGRQLAAAFDVSMSPADMRRVHGNVMRVFRDKTDPRREFINAINCWDGSGDAVRVDFQADTVGWASPDHTWHKHTDFPRKYVDVWRDEAAAWKAARAVVSVITGESRAAWVAREEQQEDDVSKADVIDALDDSVPWVSREVAAAATAAGWNARVSTRALLEYLFKAVVLDRRDVVDEQAVAAAVLAGLNPEQIAAAVVNSLPGTLAEHTAGLILGRLADAHRVHADTLDAGQPAA